MKMYFLVREEIPLGLAMTAVGHAAVAATMKWKDEPDFDEWQETSFRKVVCKVNPKQFEQAEAKIPSERRIVLTERSLEDAETVMVVFPQKELPKTFNFLPLYR